MKNCNKAPRSNVVVMLLGLVAFFGATGCVSVTEMTPEGKQVREISESESNKCQFLRSISANNTNTLSKDPRADARARAVNEVAAVGGNALRIINTSTDVAPSGVGSVFSLTGEAYKCN